MPAGFSERSSYPSLTSLESILDALQDSLPGIRVVLIGRLQRDEQTSTALDRSELDRLREHRVVAGDAFDRPLLEQLAVVERCGVFMSPHTGFGMAALAVGTPWLAISGGRWCQPCAVPVGRARHSAVPMLLAVRS